MPRVLINCTPSVLFCVSPRITAHTAWCHVGTQETVTCGLSVLGKTVCGRESTICTFNPSRLRQKSQSVLTELHNSF